MNAFEYFMQANCYLLLFYLFYFLFLKRETFFNLNRVYLLGSAFLALLIPILKVDSLKELAAQPEVLATK
jgi:bla regulator protein BlaR1